jgi:NADPH:quinone reductase-like Zn-dependent oxidoreductase
MSIAIPATVRAWQYSNVKGGLEKNLKLNTVPTPKPKDNQHLVEIIAVALNPVDYKPAELINKFYPHAATPGLDFVGRIAKPAAGTPFKIGDLVFGVAGTGSPVAGGALSEFAIVRYPESLVLCLTP